ncbi:hypothetical protein OG563_29300 [Nocardia vinacea]|uniref:Uncharacterized protein n=1 Tax=Nocardia vinacea TaxID=96468 RepID=A0ABZ1YLZ6_9NOCA|nr:hypothetical protein [Nocardia vinacea]
MPTTDTSANVSITVEIPSGYMALPLDTIDDSIAQAESLFASLGPGTVSSSAPAVLRTLRVLLTRLAQLNTMYCGLGRHVSADGQEISSTLTITATEYGDQRNPRLTLGDVLTARRDAGERFNNAEFVEVAGQLMLLLDRVRTVPTPDLPVYDTSEAEQSIYQIEAVVSAPDGSAIAVIELSTPFVEYGEEYLLPVAAMAASIEFAVTPRQSTGPSSLDL